MNSAKYIEIFKNGQKEGIRDVTVKRKLQTVRKFLSYLEDAQTDDLPNIDRKNVYEFVNSLDYRSQTISGVQFTLRHFFNIMYEQGLSSFDGYQLFPMITTDKRVILSILVDTFISKISLTMQPGPKIDSISGA